MPLQELLTTISDKVRGSAWDSTEVESILDEQKKREGHIIGEAYASLEPLRGPPDVESREACTLFYACFLAILDNDYIHKTNKAVEDAFKLPAGEEEEREERIMQAVYRPVQEYFDDVKTRVEAQRMYDESSRPQEVLEFSEAIVISKYFLQCIDIRKAILDRKCARKPLNKELDNEISKLKKARKPFRKVIANEIIIYKDCGELSSEFSQLREKVPALKNAKFGSKGKTAFEMLEVLEEDWEREARKSY